jgi:hypothetical protein
MKYQGGWPLSSATRLHFLNCTMKFRNDTCPPGLAAAAKCFLLCEMGLHDFHPGAILGICRAHKPTVSTKEILHDQNRNYLRQCVEDHCTG